MSSYTVTSGLLVASDGNIDWSTAIKQKLNSASYRKGIKDFKYKAKDPSYNVDNWTKNYGHSFNMTVVESSNQNNIKCDTWGRNGDSHGYTDRFRSVATNQPLLTSGDSYFCARKFWEGDLTTYTFELTKRPEYRIYNVSKAQIATISAPKSYEYTVHSRYTSTAAVATS